MPEVSLAFAKAGYGEGLVERVVADVVGHQQLVEVVVAPALGKRLPLSWRQCGPCHCVEGNVQRITYARACPNTAFSCLHAQ